VTYSLDQILAVLELLSTPPRRRRKLRPGGWHKLTKLRHQAHSLDLREVAELARDLALKTHKGERTSADLYETCIGRLADEIAAVMHIAYQKAVAKIEAALGRQGSARGRKSAAAASASSPSPP
jgi:RNA polymerase-interacting CarD/CdnL/TRCF family regulator